MDGRVGPKCVGEHQEKESEKKGGARILRKAAQGEYGEEEGDDAHVGRQAYQASMQFHGGTYAKC